MIKFQELEDKLRELQKNVNCAYQNSSASPPTNATTGTSGGETGMYRSEDIGLDKNVVAPMTMQMSEEDVKKDNNLSQDVMAMSEEVIKFDKNGQWSLEKSKFKTLQHKIESQGHSPESAAAITASIGRKEIGQKEMTARSKAALNKAQVPGSKYPPAAMNPGGQRMETAGPPKFGPINPTPQPPNKMATKGEDDDMDKVDPDENVNIPHPQGKAKMTNGVNKAESMKDGTNQRLANPPEKSVGDSRGNVRMVKEEGKFKVMPEVTEKDSKKEKVTGLPYNKKMHKGEGTNGEAKVNATAPKITEVKPTGAQGNKARGFDENKAPGRTVFSN